MSKLKKVSSPVSINVPAVTTPDWEPSSQELNALPDFLTLFQSAREAMFLLDSNQKIRFWNQGAQILFMFSREDVLGQSADFLVQGGWSTSCGVEKGAQGALPGNANASRFLQARGLRKDGSIFPVELTIGGEGIGGLSLIIARDMAATHRSETALKNSEARHQIVQEQLQYRVRFENLITTLSTHFIHLPNDRIDMGINYALHALGEFAEVDRAYIFIFSADQFKVDNVYEWCSRGVEAQIHNLKGLPVSRYPWFMQRIRNMETVYIPKVKDLPAAAKAEREEFEREGIASLIIVPMLHRGLLRGYLGFDSVKCEKTWSDDMFGLLRIVGEMFINTIERKREDVALNDAKSKYLNIFENAVEGIFQSTPAGHFLGVNPAMARIFGYVGAQAMQDAITEIGKEIYLDPVRRKEFVRILSERGRVIEFESQVKRQDGSIIWISENARAVRMPDGRLDYFEGTVMDVSERKRMEAKIVHGSLHDALTGLPNRTLLMERLNRALERARRKPGNLCAILMLDLDRFKMVNESMGHLYGDRMLIAFARRLEAFIPAGTTLSRLGGDEFCMLIEDMPDFSRASILAEHLQEILSMPFDLDGEEVYAAASIGIAAGTGKENGPEDVLRDADTAMHRAKTAGKGRFEVFDVSMHTKAVHLLTLETDLRKALERGEFRLHYQPIVSLHDSSLMGFEALIRWMHPRLGLVSPLDFIPLAEETGQIISIGRWVLWQSCKQLAEWQGLLQDGKHLTMSVNLSGKQLQDIDLVRQVQAILSESKLEPHSLKLEVTESAIMENPDKAASILNSLRDLGVHLSLDDFGTGYSSLSYLHRFPFHNLKIDRSFVSKMEAGNKDVEIVKVINSLAKNLGMEVVAEGIETNDQWALLHGLACTYGQGYYFSRPLEDKAATKLVEGGGFASRGPTIT
jgi:diguanylate cyclase (GGDEF)-like protein/PAS domain S-box-containing protein